MRRNPRYDDMAPWRSGLALASAGRMRLLSVIVALCLALAPGLGMLRMGAALAAAGQEPTRQAAAHGCDHQTAGAVDGDMDRPGVADVAPPADGQAGGCAGGGCGACKACGVCVGACLAHRADLPPPGPVDPGRSPPTVLADAGLAPPLEPPRP